ncbi:MAG: hypothetical protein DRO73_03870 [Candidatus Thorarchaeota archaeon]|nr:MAG: hypothetical protein DRO73_03870 [Candidatus Thorarchaeota archaeon]
MACARVFSSVLLLVLMLASVVSLVSAQTTLTPNTPLTNQYLESRQSPDYSPNYYSIYLSVGWWSVIITSNSQNEAPPEVLITVARDANFTDQLAVSGTGYGDHSFVLFNVVDAGTIHIRVEENSENGDSSGYYTIIVTDVSGASLTSQVSHEGGSTLTLLIVPPIIVTSLVFVGIVVALAVRSRQSRSSAQPGSVAVQPPTQSGPRTEYRSYQPDSDAPRVVMLPTICPSCGAPIVSEEVEWVGPLDARCSHCGAIVRARPEDL